MSIDATRWAWKQPLKANLKIILLSLADRAGENNECYPSFTRLIADTGQSKSSVIRNLAKLEELGLITSENRVTHKGNTSNLYRLIGVEDRNSPLVSDRHPPSVSLTPPLVSDRHPPSVSLTPRINQLTTNINHQQQSDVEVDFSFFEKREQTAAKKLLNGLPKQTQQEVIAVLVDKNKKEPIIKKVGYLKTVVESVNNGTFTPLPATAKPLTTADIIAKEKKERVKRETKIDNKKYFEELETKYGYKLNNVT